jgi:hypothetical protein
VRIFRRRQHRPVPVPGITSVPEAEIAVGSLSGVAPSQIRCHVLLAVDLDGGLSITTSARDATVSVVLAAAALQLAERTMSAHVHDHGSA